MSTLVNRVASGIPVRLPSALFVIPASLVIAAVFVTASVGLAVILTVVMCALAKAHGDQRIAAGLAQLPASSPMWPITCLLAAIGMDLYALAVLFGATSVAGLDRVLVPIGCAMGSYWLITTFSSDLAAQIARGLRDRMMR